MNLLPFFKKRPAAQFTFIFAFLLPVLMVAVPLVFLPVFNVTTAMKSAAGKPRSTGPTAGISAPDRESAEKLIEIRIEEAYSDALLDLAKKDSIMLSIDLRDSLMSMLVKGVPVRKCPITQFKMSRAIPYAARFDTLQSFLYPPFQLRKEWATIPKSPIRIMNAPKDTVEAEAMAGQEIPIENNDVHFTLEFNRNLTVMVEQEQPPSNTGEFRKKVKFDLERIFAEARATIKALKKRELPDHKLWIEITISRDDAKAIYRGIPVRLGMALRLPDPS